MGTHPAGLDRTDVGSIDDAITPEFANPGIGGLAPVVRDGDQVIGADGVNGDIYTVNLGDGETREVFIFYLLRITLE